MGSPNTNDFGLFPKLNTTGEGAPKIFARMGGMVAASVGASAVLRLLWSPDSRKADPYRLVRQINGDTNDSIIVVPEDGYYNILLSVSGYMSAAANSSICFVGAIPPGVGVTTGSEVGPRVATNYFRHTVAGQIDTQVAATMYYFLTKGTQLVSYVNPSSGSTWEISDYGPNSCVFIVELAMKSTRAGAV